MPVKSRIKTYRMAILIAIIFNTSCAHIGTKKTAVEACIDNQVEYYNDLCAEGRTCEGGPEDHESCNDAVADKEGFGSVLIRAHFEGVQCAAEGIKMCVKARDDGN